jgi:hypothetical protein
MSKVQPVECENCQSVLKLPVEYVGRKVRCPHCQKVFVVSAGRSTSAVVRPAESVEPETPSAGKNKHFILAIAGVCVGVGAIVFLATRPSGPADDDRAATITRADPQNQEGTDSTGHPIEPRDSEAQVAVDLVDTVDAVSPAEMRPSDAAGVESEVVESGPDASDDKPDPAALAVRLVEEKKLVRQKQLLEFAEQARVDAAVKPPAKQSVKSVDPRIVLVDRAILKARPTAPAREKIEADALLRLAAALEHLESSAGDDGDGDNFAAAKQNREKNDPRAPGTETAAL